MPDYDFPKGETPEESKDASVEEETMEYYLYSLLFGKDEKKQK